MNQSELARSVKVTPQAVQSWEKGSGIRAHIQPRLATALGVSVEWLVFGNTAQPTHELPELTQEESLLVSAYRGLKPKDKAVFVRVLRALAIA